MSQADGGNQAVREDPRAHLESALTAFKAGRIGDALQSYRAIIEKIPDQPDALHMIGVIMQQMGKTELALQFFDAALTSAPRFAQAWANHAVLLRALERKDEALQSGQAAIACDAGLADGWDVTGFLLREKKRFAESCAHHARAVALKPGHAQYRSNYAIILLRLGRIAEACKEAQAAVRLDPSLPTATLTLGNILKAAGYPDRAIDCFHKTYALNPAFLDARISEGMASLLTGDFARGWQLMEDRPYDKERFARLPRWQGEKTGHLLLHAEQGMGDALHFLRYVPLIAERATKITLQVPAPLQKLIAAHCSDMPVITPADPLPDADAHGPLLSLPYLCGTTLAGIPAFRPIEAKEDWRTAWHSRLESVEKPRIGIVWAGNPDHLNDHNRSIAYEFIAPLIAMAPAHFVSLQKNADAVFPAGLFDAAPLLNDFTETAGLMAELDLVISVDTSVLHLAGSMARPAWGLLAFDPDWRWLLGREDSPWYPAMRLFRQSQPGDWTAVITRVRAALQSYLDGDAGILRPPVWAGMPLVRNPQALNLEV